MSGIITRAALAGSGAILSLVGGALMFTPRRFLAMSEAYVGPDPSLMSELTAPSGLLLITGGFMILGTANLRYSGPALLIGAIVYGSYGAGRLVSMALHGVPSQPLIIAALFELGIAGLLASLRLTGLSVKLASASASHSSGVAA